MIRYLLFIMLFPSLAFSSGGGKSMDFTFAPLRDLVSLYFVEVEKSPYVICDSLLRDDKAVSLRSSPVDRKILTSALRSSGYDIWDESGVAVVCKPESRRQPSPEPFVYMVKSRSADYLIDQLQVLVSGKFSKTAKESSSSDVLVYLGSSSEVAVLRHALPLIDVPVKDVIVRATIYEVGDSETVESAVNVVGSVLAGRLSVDLGVTTTGAVGRLSVGGLDAVVSLLDKDSRFRLVSSPLVRVSSGQKSHFAVGAETPVAGGSVASQGAVTNNVVYRPSGVILSVTPVVRSEGVTLDVTQTVSDFVRTESGLNYTPTLNKRELVSTFTARSGEVVVLAGLSSDRQSGSEQSLWGYRFGSGSTRSNGQLVLLIQADVVGKP